MFTYVTLDGLSPNKQYEFRVFGVNDVGSGPKTDIMITTTSEAAPSGPPRNLVVETPSGWQLKVKWDLPDKDKMNGIVTKYQVKYEQSRKERLKNTTGSEKEILLEKSDGIKPYTVYLVSVSAFTAKDSKQGPFSDRIEVKTPQAAPDGPPESVTAEPEGTGIRVTWSAPSEPLNGILAGYNITYMPFTDLDPSFKEVNQTMLSTVITNLMAYTNYTVRVQALTDPINRFAGPFSKAVRVRTNEQPPSGPPQHFRAHHVTHSDISVSWMAPPVSEHNGILKFYKLRYYPQHKHFKKTVVRVDIGTPSKTISDLNPDTMYVVSVVAENSAGSGPPAEHHIRTRKPVPSRPPGNITVVRASDRKLQIIWTLPDEDQRLSPSIKYQVKCVANGVEIVKNTTGSELEILLEEEDGIEPNTNCNVSVSALTKEGQGPFSAPVPITIPHLDIGIEHGGADVDGHNISVYQGNGLSKSVDCSIKSHSADFAVTLMWKHGDRSVHTLSIGQRFGVFQANENGTQRLYINNAGDSDDGTYSCHASVGRASLVSKSFTLQFNVDCLWSDWPACCGTCGIGTQKRIEASPKRHNGRNCTGPVEQECDTLQPPCMPVVSDFFDAVVEGMTVTVECHASQFSGLGDLISFRWFRVDRRSHHDVVIDGARVINSIHGHGGGNFTGKLTFAPANKNDSGFYKCKAFNVHGSSPLSTAVFVDVKPALTNSDDCTCNCDSVMIIIAAVVLIIILLTIIAVLIAVIIYMRRYRDTF
jgi:hypothetical protein